jgi:hypothetical protein
VLRDLQGTGERLSAMEEGTWLPLNASQLLKASDGAITVYLQDFCRMAGIIRYLTTLYKFAVS